MVKNEKIEKLKKNKIEEDEKNSFSMEEIWSFNHNLSSLLSKYLNIFTYICINRKHNN